MMLGLCAIKVNSKCVSSKRELSDCAFKKPILDFLSVRKKIPVSTFCSVFTNRHCVKTFGCDRLHADRCRASGEPQTAASQPLLLADTSPVCLPMTNGY